MRHVVVQLAVCLLNAGSAHAAEAPCANNWTTEKQRLSKTGIVLKTGIDGFKVGQPPPPDFLEKIGPVLCATGTEDLRVRTVSRNPPRADPAKHAERTIQLEEFMRGRKVFLSAVNIRLNIETNEVVMINANFLPDRDIDHVPRLTAGEAKTKATAELSQALNKQLGSTGREFSFLDRPAELIYEIEQFGFAPARGVLVWELSATDVESNEWYQVHVDATTGRLARTWAWVH